jgi:VWFA-related protein
MKKRILLALFCVVVIPVFASAQNTDEEDVVKITSKLVQVDVVVTDAKGNQITDLKASDFTILQDGKQQKISGFSYVPLGSSNQPAVTEKRDKNQPLPPLGTRRPGTRGRVITFVVDDGNCRVSAVGMKASREALEKFVTVQMQPEDVVAIFQTRSGSSMFQQYTSDRNQLLRAAKKIRWYPPAGGCAPTDGSFYPAARINTEVIGTASGPKGISEENPRERDRRELSEDRARDNQIVSSLGVLQYAIRGLDRIPGRKVLFFLSDGISLRARDGRAMTAVDKLQDLTDLANRSAVVLNTIDIRGLFDATMIEARDRVTIIDNPLGSESVSNLREREVQASQDGLAYLARETGGEFFKNQNYLDAPIGQGLSIEKGFYLVAYEPDEGTFKGKFFNKIEVKLSQPDLRVSSRSGFLGIVDQTAVHKAKTGDSELYEAIAAPLPTAGMNLRLSASFANSSTAGSVVRAQVFVPGDEITFVDSNGKKKAVFDVVAVTLDEKNNVVDEFTKAHTFSVEPAAVPFIEKNGMIYSADVKVTTPGFYNFRVAMRNASSGRLGTVSQSVEIPELKRGRIHLSGLTITGVDASGKFETPSAANPDNAFAFVSSTAVPAIRQFRRGSVVAYPYTIYEATLTKDGKPNLATQVNLYRDGKLLVEGKPAPADLPPQTDWSRINDFGYLRLNPALTPGDYLLQITITDVAAGSKKAISTQYVEFEIVD